MRIYVLTHARTGIGQFLRRRWRMNLCASALEHRRINSASYNKPGISYKRPSRRAQAIGGIPTFAADFKPHRYEPYRKTHCPRNHAAGRADRLPPQKPVQQAV